MPTTASASEIRRDFDEIARLTPDRDNFGPYESWLLAQLPSRRGDALEIGCGAGHVARRLATSFGHVDAIDFSQGMIDEARRRGDASIHFTCAEMFGWLGSRPAAYDCIVTIATLHHVDLSDALAAMARSLRPGGRILIIDLMHRAGIRHFFTNVVAMIATLQPGKPWKLRRRYWSHGQKESYLTLEQVRRVAANLPGAVVRGHLKWRYSIVWEAPSVQ